MSSTLSSLSLLRLSVRTNFASEKRRSDAADVACTARYLKATLDNVGYNSSLFFHHFSGPPMSLITLHFSGEDARYRDSSARHRAYGPSEESDRALFDGGWLLAPSEISIASEA